MIILLPMDQEDETKKISKYFSRCSYFLFYDTIKKEYRYLGNTAKDLLSGAGSKASQIAIDNKTDVIICHQLGNNALNVLSLAKIEVLKASDYSAANLIKMALKKELVLVNDVKN